jgi:acyl dehydratase
MSVAPVRLAPTQELIDRWADLSGDYNPLHVDTAFAEATQFGGTIAHGHLTLALMENLMLSVGGDAWLTGGVLRNVKFRAPVRPGGAYDLHAEQEGDEWALELRAAADGTVCVTGRALVPAG